MLTHTSAGSPHLLRTVTKIDDRLPDIHSSYPAYYPWSLILYEESASEINMFRAIIEFAPEWKSDEKPNKIGHHIHWHDLPNLIYNTLIKHNPSCKEKLELLLHSALRVSVWSGRMISRAEEAGMFGSKYKSILFEFHPTTLRPDSETPISIFWEIIFRVNNGGEKSFALFKELLKLKPDLHKTNAEGWNTYEFVLRYTRDPARWVLEALLDYHHCKDCLGECLGPERLEPEEKSTEAVSPDFSTRGFPILGWRYPEYTGYQGFSIDSPPLLPLLPLQPGY